MPSLNTKKANFTKSLILEAASELAKFYEISELSFKRVSDKADISQRTMFRHFQTREEFLNALTTKLYSELELPELPDRIEDLLDHVDKVYRKFDEQPHRVLLLLGADLLPRVLQTTARAKRETIKSLLLSAFPECSKTTVEKTAANLRYVMSASSWRYYRISFEFGLQDSIDCASMIVSQGLDYLNQQNFHQ